MTRPSALLEAAARLSPFQQGRFDNLCGLYAIMNAIQLMSWPALELDALQSKRLFQFGIAALEHKGLLHEVHKHGMDKEPWAWLCNAMLAEAGKLIGVPLCRKQILTKVKKTDFNSALALIDHCTRQGEPVIVILGGSYEHYTVIVAKTASRLQLFDSFGYRWVSIASCDLAHRNAVARHQIYWRSVAAIQRLET